jgi:hypothetical protein
MEEIAAARLEMEALKNETAAVGLMEAGSPAPGAGCAAGGFASRTGAARGFGAEKASLNLSFFGAKQAKKSPTAVRQSRAVAAVANVARRQRMAAAVFDDFGSENAAPTSGAVALPRN